MNHNQKPTNPERFRPNHSQPFKRRLASRVGAILMIALLFMAASTLYVAFSANNETWLIFGAGMMFITLLAVGATAFTLNRELIRPVEVLQVGGETAAQNKAGRARDGAGAMVDEPTGGQHDLPEIKERGGQTAPLHLTEAELTEIRGLFSQAVPVEFEGIAIHQKINILAANQKLASTFGYALTEMNGRTLLDLVTPESRSTVLRNTVINYERPYAVIGMGKDGATFPIEMLSQPLTYQNQIFTIIGIRECTEHGQAEVLRELQTTKETLESKIKEGTAEVRNANERLRLELEEHKRTGAELMQRNRELTILQSAAVTITSSLDLRFVLDTVVQEMVKLLEVESCTISEYDQDNSTVVRIAGYHATDGWWDPKSTSPVYYLADYPLTKSILEEQTVEQMTISQPYIDPAELAFMQEQNIKTLLLLPMVFQRHVVGLMKLEDSRAEHTFTHQEISLARLMANQAASAIENARLYQQAQQEISERQQAEAALKEERALLAQRVKERTSELSKANAELARAARLKDEFLAAMSHELRTPLNAVLGSAEILRDEVFGTLNDKQLKYSKNIEESGRHLLELINDILDLSKIEAGKMELDLGPVSVNSVCEASLRLVKQLAFKKRLQVSARVADNMVTLIADERRLKQILVNLLSNAIKFTPEGGQMGLEAVSDAEQQAVHFTVWDTGIGIAPADMGRLFQPFVQLDSKLSREYAGTGLGLSLVSRMTEMHGGGISVDSEVGQGSRFTVSLPWAEAIDTTAADIGLKPGLVERGRGLAQKSNGGKRLILLADDNEDNINLLVEYLEAQQYQLVVARNGQEAIDRAKEEKPDLILMDVQMPGMDGLEATRRLRKDAVLAGVPVIAVTALAMPGDRERCLAAGANEYFSKPVNLRGLVRTIEMQLNRFRVEELNSA